jgi:hypothetical protein
MKVYGGQRNHIKRKHKRQLKQQRWDAGHQINNGAAMTARHHARAGRAQHPLSK